VPLTTDRAGRSCGRAVPIGADDSRRGNDLEAAGVVPEGRGAKRRWPSGLTSAPTPDRTSAAREGWWRRRESNPRPKARRRGTLHACPLLFSRARREKAAKNRQAPDPEHLTVARRAAAQPPACLMTFDPQPPGEAEANAHSLIRLRERTENPQLTDVPSDLRVNGARHASRDLELPSKPNSPPRLRSVQGTPLRRSGRPQGTPLRRSGRPQGTPLRRSGRQRAGRSPTHLAIVRHRPLGPALTWPSRPSDTIPWHSLAPAQLGGAVPGSAGSPPDGRYSRRRTGG